VAMYEAKKSGRGCCVEFDATMRARITRRVLLESSLMTAIGTPQVSLAYQPIVELESGRMVAVEALLRWRHPELGEVEPAEFVPLAEETGLIVPLGAWVMREACQQLAAWQRQDPQSAPALISVNLSRAELALGSRLVERIRDALLESGLAPQCLQIEIAEREVVRNPGVVVEILQDLRQLGVRLSMDEFGTGTSSLSCLRGFPFDTVKIDRSFTRGLASNRDVMALIHATLTLVENLGMASVAEGIEDTAQLAILQSLGCRFAQGRLFSQPLAGAELLDGWNASCRTELEDAPPPASANAA
jgi:EAL domain-containing protein (putative c-di-GMP-specific phosphodiesterase class I)